MTQEVFRSKARLNISYILLCFRVCESGVGMCTFPVANVSFVKNGHDEVSFSWYVYIS